MKKVEEFDWEWTRRKVMVIMPYYGNRLRQMAYALAGIRTELDDSEWGVIVGDDGCGHDISSVEKIKNVKVVKIRNDGSTERNGCLCRNVLIKRCQSDWVISVDPEIHWTGDFFKTICDHPNNIVRVGNTRNISVHTIEDVLLNKIDINKVEYKEYHTFAPNDPINENSVVIIDPHSDKSIGAWGVHYGLALETKAWHALRGYNENMVNYGPDDWDMLERMLKMMDNSFLRKFSMGKKGKMHKIPQYSDPQFLSDVEVTRGMITNFHIASNIFATHLYHERLTGPITWYPEERSKPGFIRNRDIEWGMSYDK
jgi:predicted glycosyltransferase involved in capsule biosynthesis